MAVVAPLFRFAAGRDAAVADADLLARFAVGRDEEAFAELVRRHGPVVYRVCRRLVGAADADDAFQATFLVLATRPHAAAAAGAVAGWLVGVAGRVARQTRRSAWRRTRHEARAAGVRPAEPADRPADPGDQFRLLDEELAALPARLRDPVVLCLLQGHTQQEAAARLGRDARTVRRRLDRAKQILRLRLERRGVAPAVAAAVMPSVGAVAVAVPPDLGGCTVETVFDFLTGGTGAARTAPVVLANGVAATMLTRKLIGPAVTATASLVGLGAVLAGNGPPAPPTPAVARPAPPGGAPVMPPASAPSPPPNDIDWEADEVRTREVLAAARRARGPGDADVLIDGLCVRVPAGFCRRAGLTEEDKVWALTPRERRMLSALLRAEPAKQVDARLTFHVRDDQTGFSQVGQHLDVVTGLRAEVVGGRTVYTPTTMTLDLGVTMRVTPRLVPDGRIMLRVESEAADPADAPVPVPVTPAGGAGGPAESLRFVGWGGTMSQSLQATVLLSDGGTVVFPTGGPPTTTRAPAIKPDGPGSGTVVTRGRGGPADERLWVLTAHLVRGGGPHPPGPVPGRPVPLTMPPPAKP